MKRHKQFCLILWMLSVHTAYAEAPFPAEFEQIPEKRFVAAEDAYYGPVEPALRKLVVAHHKQQNVNHFCVIGYVWPDKQVAVWVHWQEEQRLLLWRENADVALRKAGLVHALRNLKLGQDTVDSIEQIQGSSYLVSKAWWHAVVQDCARHGQKFVVKPRKK